MIARIQMRTTNHCNRPRMILNLQTHSNPKGQDDFIWKNVLKTIEPLDPIFMKTHATCLSICVVPALTS